MDEPAWSIKVEDFGPIKSGTVTLAPLTVFVGPNNTGKSYMASLVWMLLEAEKTVLQQPDPSGRAFDTAAEIPRAIRRGEKTLIENKDWLALVAWVNEALVNHAESFVRSAIANQGLFLKSIDVSLTQAPPDLQVRMDPLQWSVSLENAHKGHGTFGTQFLGDRLAFLAPNGLVEDTNLDQKMLRTLARRLAPSFNGATYIPAARTGLMVALPFIIASLILSLDASPDERARQAMPATLREFLVSLQYAGVDRASDQYNVAQFLERSILGGEIKRAGSSEFQYVHAFTGIGLPLHAASSMVTELAPLILLLKGGIGGGCLIFEEPEAHLHLSAQRTLARALIRLVNTGTPVLITTHSDTFLQQINILMQIHDHPHRDELAAEFGYEQADFLDPAKVHGYMFGQEDGGTIVSELEKTPEGFVEPLMNRQIAELTHEVLRMERT